MNPVANEIVAKEDTTKSPVEASELLNGDAGNIQATTVSMDRAGAEQITAQRVSMDRSGARQIDARSAQLDQSGVLRLNSEHAVMHDGTAGLIAAQEVRFVRSRALAVIAGRASAEGEMKSVVYVGPSAGNVRTLLDAKGAVGLGAGLGLALLVAKGLWRRIGGN